MKPTAKRKNQFKKKTVKTKIQTVKKVVEVDHKMKCLK